MEPETGCCHGCDHDHTPPQRANALGQQHDAQIQDVMDQLNANPGQIDEIMKAMGDNPEILQQLGNRVQNIPGLKETIAKKMTGNQKLTNKVKAMPAAQKKAMAKAAKKHEYNMNHINQCIGVRLTQNNQAKRYTVSNTFPAGTIFEDGNSIDIGATGVTAYYGHSSITRNKRASTIVGDDVFGEVILIRENEEGKFTNFTLDEFKTTFG